MELPARILFLSGSEIGSAAILSFINLMLDWIICAQDVISKAIAFSVGVKS
jgi:hypothetical protein